MKSVVEFPDQGVLAEEAAEWLVRLDADTPPSRHELRALGEWLHRSPAHREELKSLATLWGRMNVLTELALPLGKADRRSQADRPDYEGAGRGPWLRQAAVAAAIVGAFTLGLAYYLRGAWNHDFAAANGLYATAVGQQSATELPDGSGILLNTNSQIRVAYGDAYRDVTLLQGEALFTVAKDSGRPFRVYAGSGRIQAVGTAFSVYLKGPVVQVTVTEGRVALASSEPLPRSVRASPKTTTTARANDLSPTQSIAADEFFESLGTLSAGQVATIRSASEELPADQPATLTTVMPLPPQELAARLAWRDGILMFSGDPLEEVVREVSRYTTVSIEIPDPQVRNMRIGGRFPVGETDVMFAALQSNFNLRVTHLGHNRVVVTAAND